MRLALLFSGQGGHLPGMPHLGSGIICQWQRQGRTVMAMPNLSEGVISIIDRQN